MPLWNPSSNSWKQSGITVSDLTSLIACCHEMACWAGSRKTMDTCLSGWCLALAPKRFSLNLSKYGLQEQFVRYIANWFYHHSKRVVESMLWVPVGYKQSTLWFGTGTHIAQLFHQQIRWWHRICPQVNLQI